MNFGGAFDESDFSRSGLLDRVQLPWTDALGAAASDAWVHNPSVALGDMSNEYLAQNPWARPVAKGLGRVIQGVPGLEGYGTALESQAEAAQNNADTQGADQLIDPKTLNDQYSKTLGLGFDKPMRKGAVDILVNERQEQLKRDQILSRAPDGMLFQGAKFATSLAVSAADPLNIAASFIPVVGEARYGLWAERYGATLARLGTGAIEGAVGNAAIQPIEAARDYTFQEQYGPMDAFMNVAFGAALGGGLHLGFGVISDLLSRAAPETREAALRSAVGQMAEGRPVDVSAVLASDPKFLSSLPFADEKGLRLLSHAEQSRQTLGGLTSQLSALPQGDTTAADTLARLSVVEKELTNPDLEAADRKALSTRRDELLSNTTPEQLQAAAAPLEQRRVLQNQIENTQKELSQVQQQLAEYQASKAIDQTGPLTNFLMTGRTSAVPAFVGPERASVFGQALDRTRAASVAFTRHLEPSTLASPETLAAANEMVRTKSGDNIDEEYQNVMNEVASYEKQGILTPEEVAEAKSGDTDLQQAKTRGDAAQAAARCLLLHP